jgi:alkylhydroperoxidase family enzyme
MHGLTPDELTSARDAESADPRVRAILELAAVVNRARGHIGDADIADARHAGLDDAEVVETVAFVALNVFTNFLNSVAQTAIDFPEVALATA